MQDFRSGGHISVSKGGQQDIERDDSSDLSGEVEGSDPRKKEHGDQSVQQAKLRILHS